VRKVKGEVGHELTISGDRKIDVLVRSRLSDRGSATTSANLVVGYSAEIPVRPRRRRPTVPAPNASGLVAPIVDCEQVELVAVRRSPDTGEQQQRHAVRLSAVADVLRVPKARAKSIASASSASRSCVGRICAYGELGSAVAESQADRREQSSRGRREGAHRRAERGA
jgi:hypothetical protein